MKKIIFISGLVIATITAIAFTFNSSECCKGKSCDKKSAAAVSCDNNCKAGEPCSCSTCSGECKKECEEAGHCVCGESNHKVTSQHTVKVSPTTLVMATPTDCGNNCNHGQACTNCDDCTGACKQACEENGGCACN